MIAADIVRCSITKNYSYTPNYLHEMILTKFKQEACYRKDIYLNSGFWPQTTSHELNLIRINVN
jgi:hypothetical protein